MQRSTLALLVVSAIASIAIGGCYFTRSPSRPLPALEFRRNASERQQCLVVFVPGFIDGPDTFLDHEFPSDVITHGAPCDSVAVDLHYRYYWDPPASGTGVANVMFADVLEPAAARGYQEIWLVGISMGGLGTLLTAERHPELITGIILLAPFVGDEATVREIEAAGGAAEWQPPAGIDAAPWTQENYTTHLWAWLRNYETDPDSMPPLYIGWGADDRLSGADHLLAEMQPDDHVMVIPGNHGWATWRPLFDTFLDRARPGR